MQEVTKIRIDFKWIAILVVFFWGDPDLLDAIIHWLMQ